MNNQTKGIAAVFQELLGDLACLPSSTRTVAEIRANTLWGAYMHHFEASQAPKQRAEAETCNGWKNRETWAVNLYLSNDLELYRYVKALASTDCDHAALAGNIKGWFEGLWFTVTKGRGEHQAKYCAMLKDIGSLDRVDWQAIAEQFPTDEARRDQT